MTLNPKNVMNKTLLEDIKRFAADFSLYEGLRGRNILVTGATGLLGSCTVRALLALNDAHGLGMSVTAVVRNMEKARRMFGDETQKLRFYEYDFAQTEPFQPETTPYYIIHLAAPTASKYFVEHPVETMTTVHNGTLTMLEYARTAQVAGLVYVSTLEVYGTVLDGSTALDEQQQGYLNPTEARSSYPMAKREAECLCHAYASEYGVPVTIARLAQTFGAGVSKDDGRVFAQFARNVITGNDIVLHTRGELCRCYCYTMDAVSAFLYLLQRGEAGEAYNVANEDSYISIIDMAEMVCREFNPAIQPVVKLQEGMGYSPTTRLRLSTAKMQRLGWKPRYSLREMFDRLITSMKEE